MRYPQCNNLCEPDLDVHYLGRRNEKACLLREQARDVKEFIWSTRTCQCGAKAVPHVGMAYPCPLTASGQHIQ